MQHLDEIGQYGPFISSQASQLVFTHLKEAQKSFSLLFQKSKQIKTSSSSNIPSLNISKILDHLISQILLIYEKEFTSLLSYPPSVEYTIPYKEKSQFHIRSLLRKGDSVESSPERIARGSTPDTGSEALESARYSRTKFLELERRVDLRQKTIQKLESKLKKLDQQSLKMRIDFLKQLQHLKEMAHRNQNLPNFTFLEVKFFSAEDGFDQNMTFLLNKRLEEVRDQYNRRMVTLQKHNVEIKQKVEHFELICADGNYGIPFKEMGTESILRKLAIIENNPFVVWRIIEQYFGSGFFNDVIIKEYDISKDSTKGNYQSEIAYQLDDYEKKAKEHLNTISSQSQVEITLLRKYLRDKECELMEHNNKVKEAVEIARQEERKEAELRLKELKTMLEKKYDYQRLQLERTVPNALLPAQGKGRVVDQEEMDKMRLRNALTKWWFKAKLITMMDASQTQRYALIDKAENEMRKKEIEQLATVQDQLNEVNQKNYELNKANTEMEYELGVLKRTHDRKCMEFSQMNSELITIQKQYKETLNEKMTFENSSHQLLKSAEAQRAYISNMERELFDLEQWINRVTSLDRSLRPPKALVSKTKQKQIAETANKKAIKELYDTTVQELGKLEKDRYKEKEVLTLLHDISKDLDLKGPKDEKPALEVETQTTVKYFIDQTDQTGDELLSDLKGRISEVKELEQDKRRTEKKLKSEIKRLKEKVDKLKEKLKTEKQLRQETVKKRESERIEHLKLLEELKEEKEEDQDIEKVFRRQATMVDEFTQSKMDLTPKHKVSAAISQSSQDRANVTLHTYETESDLDSGGQGDTQSREKIVVTINNKYKLEEVREKEESKTPSELTNPSPIEQGAPVNAENIHVFEGRLSRQISTPQHVPSTDLSKSIRLSPTERQISPSPIVDLPAATQPSQPAPPPHGFPVYGQAPRRLRNWTFRQNMSLKEQRPVFKVVPFNVDAFDKILEKKMPPRAEKGIQTEEREFLKKQSSIEDSPPILLKDIVNLAKEEPKNPSKFRSVLSSGNLLKEHTLSARSVRIAPPQPPPLQNIHIANFVMNASETSKPPTTLSHVKSDSLSSFMTAPNKSAQEQSNLITISHHQKLQLNKKLRSWGVRKQMPAFSLTNVSLQPTKQPRGQKRLTQLQRNFSQRIKKASWTPRHKPKVGKEREKEEAQKISL